MFSDARLVQMLQKCMHALNVLSKATIAVMDTMLEVFFVYTENQSSSDYYQRLNFEFIVPISILIINLSEIHLGLSSSVIFWVNKWS